MALNGECPECGLRGPLIIFRTVIEAKQAIAIIDQLPRELRGLALHYIDLFRPASGRATAINKAVRLLTELKTEISSGFVQVERQVARSCPPRIWAEAIQAMIDRRSSLRLPMPNHNYLKEIAYDLADAVDRENEAQIRQKEASGTLRGGRGNHHEKEEVAELSEAELAALPEAIRNNYKKGRKSLGGKNNAAK